MPPKKLDKKTHAPARKVRAAKSKTPAKSSTKKKSGNVSTTKPVRKKKPAEKQAATNSQPVAEVIERDEADVVRFGKHRGELWSEVPGDYLDWVVENAATYAGLARAEIARREIARREIVRRGSIEIMPAAIDEASLKLRDYWDATRGTWEGLYSWLQKVAGEAQDKIARHPSTLPPNHIEHNGIMFEFVYSASSVGKLHIALTMIRNPKAGIPWAGPVRKSFERIDYADRAREVGRGVW